MPCLLLWLAVHMLNPHFTACWLHQRGPSDAPAGAGRGGVRPCDALHALAASNDLQLVDTVTDGNCGLHAFLISSQYLFTTIRKQPWSLFSKKLEKQAVFTKLRKLATTWISAHASDLLWEDFSIADLVRATSSDRSLESYLDRQSKPGQWLDTTMVHALGCVFSVDIVILQAHDFMTSLGASDCWLGVRMCY
jgi:hypothetical protein